jgi:hypothetical protein
VRLPLHGAAAFGSDSKPGISYEVPWFSSGVTTDDDVGDFECRVTYFPISLLSIDVSMAAMLSAARIGFGIPTTANGEERRNDSSGVALEQLAPEL